ncbi:MAG: 2-hydroxyacid dehydrogenase [Clostridiaceae bacterium]|nr:2-hydroxyacid dehydrogenase [Clostridiaceae bacterium]
MKIAFYDAKPYDKVWFDRLAPEFDYKIKYIESRLTIDNCILAKNCDAVCVFVNDKVTAEVIDELHAMGVQAILLRCAGYNNVDFKAAYEKIYIMRVAAYSPYAVAEYASALLLSVNRKIHRAYSRTRDFNFNINGLMGMDMHGKTAGIIGTGRIGQIMIDILRGYGMKIIAYDLFPPKDPSFEVVPLERIWEESDVISLHCPLTPETKHMVNAESLARMKSSAILINTSRGGLIDTAALNDAVKNRKIAGVGLDVYEEEDEYFFEDRSNDILEDEALVRLMSFPNVLVTSHQAFFTAEAMEAIARTTLENLKRLENGEYLENEICYQCGLQGACDLRKNRKNCFEIKRSDSK